MFCIRDTAKKKGRQMSTWTLEVQSTDLADRRQGGKGRLLLSFLSWTMSFTKRGTIQSFLPGTSCKLNNHV
jgi:hypothetical protein